MFKYPFIAVIYGATLLAVTDAQEGPRNSVVLIIRHAENPADGHGLSAQGKERAKAYKNYFQSFAVDGKRLEPEAVVVAADSKQSHRPRLTVQPFATAANLTIDNRFANKQPADLAAMHDWLRRQASAFAAATAVGPTMPVLHGSVRWRRQSDGHQTVSDESKLLPELLRGHADKNSRTGSWSAFRGPAWVHLVVRDPQFERRGRPSEPLLCER